MHYWRWLIHGLGGRPSGLSKFVDVWLIVHVVVGVLLAVFVPLSAHDAANTVLLPLAGIFVGLCFAWGGNANALLQTQELERLAAEQGGGVEEYAWTYQTAVLVFMITLVTWAFAGLNLFQGQWSNASRAAGRFALYFLCSVTMRECWAVVLGANLMLIARSRLSQGKAPPPK